MDALKGNMKTKIFLSRLSGLEHGSNRYEGDLQSSEGGPVSVKSEISVETKASRESAESSCSNPLSVVLAVSSPSEICQETSKEAHLFKNYGSSMDSCNVRSPEEPSSESGVSARVAVRNAKERNTMKVSLMAGTRSTVKGDEEDAAEVSKRNKSGVGKSCLSYDNFDSCKGGSEEISREVEVKSFVGFDLNEDINTNTLDDFIQPVAVPSHNVIHVVAKAGILIGRPSFPLKFEGVLGWKGSSKASAFRPVTLAKDEQCSTGFDLNVAAPDDDEGTFLQSEVDSKQNKSLLFDLNCPYDATDEFTPPKPGSTSDSLPPNRISDSERLDLDLDRHRNPKNTHSMQPKLPLMSPPQAYSYPFHFATGSTPYARFHENTTHHHQNTCHIPNFFDAKSADSSTRQIEFLLRGPPLGERSNGTKRKEPEGGLEYLQLGYKHLH